MSNILSDTPTVDTTASHISKPVWVVRVNGSPNSDAILGSVTLSYGANFSSAIFRVLGDPDTGTFPTYNDAIEVDINGRNVFKGKIKGITSRISSAGLLKTFTSLANITTLTEKVVDPENREFNGEDVAEDDKLNVSEIVQSILGYIPVETPTDDPGEIIFTDMTQLDAVQTTVNKVGNHKLFWNKDTNLLEFYQFGQGGDITRRFEKGVNLLNLAITENRQSIVNKMTIVGPPKAVRVRQIVSTSLDPDENGVYRQSFTITGENIRDVVVEGQFRDRAFFEHDGKLQMLPEDMGFPVNTSGPLTGFAEWPFFPFAVIGNTRGDIGFRTAVKGVIIQPTILASIGTSIEYDRENDSAKIFLSNIPKTWLHILKSASVNKEKFGLSGGLGDTVTVRVVVAEFWVRGQVRVTFTKDEDIPTVSSGSGTIERTITDSQYQIFVDPTINPAFDNEAEILALMKERADAELDKVNRPSIGGSIAIEGDETVDLKSTVLINNQKLDVVNIVHSFVNGFITTVSLTNEPFFSFIAGPVSQPERRKRQEQQITTQTHFRFEKVETDQEFATQRQIEFQRRLQDAAISFATFQD